MLYIFNNNNNNNNIIISEQIENKVEAGLVLGSTDAEAMITIGLVGGSAAVSDGIGASARVAAAELLYISIGRKSRRKRL